MGIEIEPTPTHGQTPNELARMLRVSPDRVRAWIRDGSLPAINTAPARCGKPRFIVLPDGLAVFLKARSAAIHKPAPRRRRQTSQDVDYFP